MYFWVRISSTFSVPFSCIIFLQTIFIYWTFFCSSTARALYFDLFSSARLLRHMHFDICQIRISYWSSSTGLTKVLVEVKFDQKSRSNILVRSKVGGSTYRKCRTDAYPINVITSGIKTGYKLHKLYYTSSPLILSNAFYYIKKLSKL